MTYQRVISRNRLKDGDYSKVPESVSHLFSGDLTFDTLKRLKDLEGLWRTLAGDLRRFEKDAVDEKAMCELIASKTNVAPDIVAGVLREFLAT